VALYADVLPNAITELDRLLVNPNNNVAGRAALLCLSMVVWQNPI